MAYSVIHISFFLLLRKPEIFTKQRKSSMCLNPLLVSKSRFWKELWGTNYSPEPQEQSTLLLKEEFYMQHCQSVSRL